MAASFDHGVAAGDPTTDGVVLQTAVSGVEGDLEVRWELDDVTHPAVMVAEGTAVATEANGYTVRVTVNGLEPGHQYRYRFLAGDATSPGGRFRTLPADPHHLRFAVVCCAKFNSGFFNVYGRVAERQDLDFVLHDGDYIYEASQTPPASQTPGADIGRPMDPLGECRHLDDYRTRYRQYRGDPDVQALHRGHAVFNTIDDHELADNAWSGGSQEHDPERDGPWSVRKAEALQAWHEWIPSRVDPDAGDRIWRSVDLGALARLVIFETRTTRSEPGIDRIAVGPEQEAWFDGETTRAPLPAWLLVGMPSSLAKFWKDDLSDLSTEALRKLKLVEPDGSGPARDRWDGMETERNRLLTTLAATPTGRLALCGDVHVAIDSDLHAPDGRFAGTCATSPSVTSPNMDDKMGWELGGSRTRGYEDAILADLPALRWVDIDYHGYLVVDLDAESATIEWWGVDSVLEPDTGQKLLHKIRVDRTGTREVLPVG